MSAARPAPPPSLVENIPTDLLAYILSFTRGIPCEEVARRCATSVAFNDLCNDANFWRWQCQLRAFDRRDRLVETAPGVFEPRNGTWRRHYEWWCDRVHTNDTLKEAIRLLYEFQEYGDTHPVYGPVSSWDTSEVTSMEFVFRRWIPAFAGMSNWDVSSVVSMENMFGLTYLNIPPPDLSQWKTTSLENMEHMFAYSPHADIPGLGNLDTANVESIDYIFLHSEFNGDLSGWDTSKLRTMHGAFESAAQFTGESIVEWDVSNVVDFSEAFKDASNFNADLSKWRICTTRDDSNFFDAVQMAYMFQGVRDFTGTSIENWNVRNVVNMSYMFAGSEAFNANLSRWDVSRVIDFSSMFRRTESFEGVGVDVWTTSSAWNMREMFAETSRFNADLSDWDISKVENMSGMFRNSSKFEGQGLRQWDMSNVRLHYGMFENAEELDTELVPWAAQIMATD